MREFLIEYWEFVKARKMYWLLPLLIVLIIVGFFLVMAQGSVAAPFIYTFF